MEKLAFILSRGFKRFFEYRPSEKTKKNLPFWLSVLAVFTGAVLPRCLKDGMFMDGLFYAVIARNLAEGQGTFWSPHFTATEFSPFYLSPPLGMAIQAVFFKVFGDHFLVERLYSFGTGLLTAFLMARIWKTAARTRPELEGLGWLPVFLWAVIPINFFSYSNNMLENTMGIFTLLAVHLLLKGLTDPQKVFPFTILAGVSIVAGVLTKVPTAFFPLAVPVIFWLVFRTIPFKKALQRTALLLAAAGAFFFLLMQIPAARQNLEIWFQTHLLRSLRGEIEPTARTYLLKKLIEGQGLLLPAVLTALLAAFLAGKKVSGLSRRENWKWPLFFLLVALSASLPIMLSPNQKGYYLLPSFPFFALALGLLAAPGVSVILKNLNPAGRGLKLFTATGLITLAAALVFSVLQTGKTGRDRELLDDVRLIGNNLPPHSVIGICPSMREDWPLHGYFARYFKISLDARRANHDYYLTRDHCNADVETTWEKVPLKTRTCWLYRRPSGSAVPLDLSFRTAYTFPRAKN